MSTGWTTRMRVLLALNQLILARGEEDESTPPPRPHAQPQPREVRLGRLAAPGVWFQRRQKHIEDTFNPKRDGHVGLQA